MKLAIPQEDKPELAGLPEPMRHSINQWMRELAKVQSATHKGQAFKRAAAVLHTSWQTVQRKFYAVKASGDWRALIDRAKVRDNGERVPEPIIEEFARRADRNQRKSRPEWRRLMSQWRRGELADLPWPEINGNGLPHGCSYDNLMRQLRSRGRRNFELTAMRDGLGAAMSAHGPKFLSTRVGLWVGSHFLIDDLKLDFEVVLLSNGGQTAIVQEIGVLDLFSGDRFAVGRRPKFLRADGVTDSLKEREVRFVLADVLRNTGYSPRGTEIVSELGTAAVRQPLAKWLYEQSGEKITVRLPGDLGKAQAVSGFHGRGGGNPRHKTQLESHHNLRQNELGDLPAQVGHDRNPPEWLFGLQAITGQVIKWMRDLPAERAAMLCLPQLEYWQALAFLAQRDDVIAWRTDHELEGWEECLHTTLEYRANLLADEWLSPVEFLALPPQQQRELAQAAALMPALRRSRKLAPREVFARGAQELCPLPDPVIAMMFCDRELGDDLRVTKTLNSEGEFSIEEGAAEPGRMHFAGTVLTPEGGERRLDGKTKFGCVLNPFDRARLWIYDQRGGFLGTAERRDRTSPLDLRSRDRQLGYLAKEKSALLTPLGERHAGAAAEIAAIKQHNAAVRQGTTPEDREQARADRRIAPAMDAFLDKPADSSATTDDTSAFL